MTKYFYTQILLNELSNHHNTKLKIWIYRIFKSLSICF